MSRIAIVTGSNTGIGFEIARKLGAAGLQVVMACMNEAAAAAAVESLRGEGFNVEYRHLDIGTLFSF